MNKSLYELICESRVGDSVLPPDFSLPDEDSEENEGMRFADGAMDGIYIYHVTKEELNEEARQRLGDLLVIASSGIFDEAEEGFKEFCKEHRAITIIDELQNYLFEHEREVAPDKLYEFAVRLLLDSESKEGVKIGLSILELFDVWENEELAGAIRRIGLSDEFTIFSIFNMRRWPAADAEIFELLKRVRGWGRVHCIDFIETDDEEIKKWLFLNGVDNDVMPAYSAWPVYVKADVEKIIDRDDLSYDEVHALLVLTDALMDEGPVSGVSNMDDPKGYIEKVIKIAKSCSELNEEDNQFIKQLITDKGGQL